MKGIGSLWRQGHDTVLDWKRKIKFISTDEDIKKQIAKESGEELEVINRYWDMSVKMSRLNPNSKTELAIRDTAIIYTRLMCRLSPRHSYGLVERIYKSLFWNSFN